MNNLKTKNKTYFLLYWVLSFFINNIDDKLRYRIHRSKNIKTTYMIINDKTSIISYKLFLRYLIFILRLFLLRECGERISAKFLFYFYARLNIKISKMGFYKIIIFWIFFWTRGIGREKSIHFQYFFSAATPAETFETTK